MKNATFVSLCAAAACAVLAGGADAATLTLSYTNIQLATNATFTTGVQDITLGADHIIPPPPPGTYLRFGILPTVTGNPNTPGAIDTGEKIGVPQPAQLGVASFGASYANSNPAYIQPRTGSGNLSTAIVNSQFVSTASPGVVDAASGSVGAGSPANLIYGGVLTSSVDGNDATGFGRLRIGTNQTVAGDALFTRLSYLSIAFGVGATLTPTFSTSNIAFVTTAYDGLYSPGTGFIIAPNYTNRAFNPATDTLVGPGPLILGLPEPASLTLLGVAGTALLARRRRA